MMRFTLQSTGKEIDFAPARVIIAGYTGRNQDEVRAHVRELAAQGIPAPAEIPAIFRTTLDRLTVADEIEVVGGRTAGEAEVVLLVKGEVVWVAVGSDHTDRELEKIDIAASKQVCPKPVSGEVWNYADVRERWDNLILRSWVGESGREQLYQEGRMAALLRPEDVLVLLRRRLGKLVDGATVYTGTIPLIGGAFVPKPYFEAALFDPVAGRSLRCAYRTRSLEA
ncbi:MAG TPA: DUF2848 family protein [Candidatus Binatia bacterium]|jgi:hypothetical protein